MSWETTDVLSADTTDVLSADTTDVLSADTLNLCAPETTLPQGLFSREKHVFPWEKGCVLGWENTFLGLMGVVVQRPPAVFPPEK